ncbi:MULTISPECIES: heme-degrading domain-containing protein [Streptomyces]|uniref:heme-degrading domain-containing protein n=1 Tax=Streptomyces TaxID=1883 RepID=UPI000A8E5619|nr:MULTISPECIES: heme-degrading domain-containing protein [Streptomyces]
MSEDRRTNEDQRPDEDRRTNGDEVEVLEAQEARLVLPRFTYEDAWTLGTLLVGMAREREAPVAIDIRRGPQQLFHCALPGSSADNDAWIDRKRRVVERYGSSSFLVGARFRAKGTTFEASSRLDPDRYAAHGGSFPVAVEGVGVIGSVTVSGLPQAEDHALVVEALERLLGSHTAASG